MGPASSNSRNKYRNLQTLLQTVCLRRTRDILALPETIASEILVPLSDRERSKYNELYERFEKLVQMAVSGRKSKISATVLHSIHELRLFCNNGPRISGNTSLESDDELLSHLQQQDMNFCANCRGSIFSIDQIEDTHGGTFISSCKHLVCHSCLPQFYQRGKRCKLCLGGDVPISPFNDSMLVLHPTVERDISISEAPAEEYPSKLQALLSDLRKNTSNKRFAHTCSH
jgi:SNF2 family DNA or RNA helicase